MPQHDMIIDNASGAQVRADLNNALAALASTMKGPNAPPSPVAGMLWLDDNTPSSSVWTLKLYDGADWLTLGVFDITANAFVLGGADGLRIDADGRVSIGLASNAGALHHRFDAGVADGYTARYIFQGNDQRLTLGAYWQSGVGQYSRIQASNNAGAANALLLNPDGGNVGLGTLAPAQRLHIHAANSGAVYQRITNNDSGLSAGLLIGLDAAEAGVIRVETNNPLIFGTNNTERARIDAGGNFLFNSGYGSVAVAYGVRAWVNFNGTGTAAIRGSGGVTSITDNGVGDYTVNFSFTMPDANYAYSHSYSQETAGDAHADGYLHSMTTTGLRVQHFNDRNNAQTADKSYVLISVVR